MRVAGSHYGLTVFITERNYPAIEVAKSFVVSNFTFGNKKSVIADRLYFQIIVKVYDILYFSLGLIIE